LVLVQNSVIQRHLLHCITNVRGARKEQKVSTNYVGTTAKLLMESLTNWPLMAVRWLTKSRLFIEDGNR